MNKNINENIINESKLKMFEEEITTNFANLFVDTYLIRYYSEFGYLKISDSIKRTSELLEKKIKNEFESRLLDINFKN